jgi:hypothetical protein
MIANAPVRKSALDDKEEIHRAATMATPGKFGVD